MTSVTIQRFHEDVEATEEASQSGPVLITSEHGEPKCVLIDIQDYLKLCDAKAAAELCSIPKGQPELEGASTLADRLAVPDDEYFEWEPERLYFTVRPVDFD